MIHACSNAAAAVAHATNAAANATNAATTAIIAIAAAATAQMDTALARHVTHVHQHGVNPDLDFEPLSPEFIKRYIAQARSVTPHVPRALMPYIVEAYVELRQQDAAKPSDQTAMTARQLLSILRLSQVRWVLFEYTPNFCGV
jgi:DNA replicative helicase MCM subunit Mcm2 (Cdc46/Mcm family)